MHVVGVTTPYSNTLKCLLRTDNSMTGRAYIGEVLIQIWLKSMKK